MPFSARVGHCSATACAALDNRVKYIGLALAGAFQAEGWRNHGGIHPAEQWFWWSSTTASPVDPGVPELASNFGRFPHRVNWTLWGVVANRRVPNITNLEIPGYGLVTPIIGGRHRLTQVWCLEGDCQG